MDRILGIKGSWGFSQLTNTVETIAAPENAVLQVQPFIHVFYVIVISKETAAILWWKKGKKQYINNGLWKFFQFIHTLIKFKYLFFSWLFWLFSEFLGCFHWGSREYIWLSLHRWEDCCGNQKMVESVSQWACVIVSPAIITDILHIQGHPYISPWQPSYCKDYSVLQTKVSNLEHANYISSGLVLKKC